MTEHENGRKIENGRRKHVVEPPIVDTGTMMIMMMIR
jgi:hypothetical protein